MAGRAAHVGLLFIRFITLGSVVSSCYAHDRLREMRPTTTLKRTVGAEERLSAGSITNRNDSAPRSLLGSVCETQNGNPHHGTRIIALASRHSVADYSSGLVARRDARISFASVRPIAQKVAFPRWRQRRTVMSDTEQREIAEILFEPSQTREEIRDAIKLEEERRAALVRNLYRLRALRLSRGLSSVRIQEG
jgi:hypothetical protein